MHDPSVPATSARGREIALLTNPAAGSGKGARYRDADEAADLARGCVADGVEALVVCGGDGMVHLAIQALAGTGVPLGLIPAGTGNDVGRYFDLPRRDPVAAADRIVASRRRTIDLARCGDRYFLTVMAAGFDAIVNERANAMAWPRGQMRYNLATLAELRTFVPIPYTLQLDGETVRTEAMLVAVGNGPSFGGGLRITEGALLDDGLLDVVVITRMSRPKLVRSYPRLFTGTIDGVAEYVHRRVRSATIAAPGIVTYADGERFGPLPLTVECAPGALEVLA